MDVLIGIFATIGFIAVIFLSLNWQRFRTPTVPGWQERLNEVEMVFSLASQQRSMVHRGGWHARYSSTFAEEINRLGGLSMAQLLELDPVSNLPLFLDYLAETPSRVIESAWQDAQKKARGFRDNEAESVLYDLLWVILSAEILRRLSSNETQTRRAYVLLLRAARAVVPGSQKADNRLP